MCLLWAVYTILIGHTFEFEDIFLSYSFQLEFCVPSLRLSLLVRWVYCAQFFS